MIWEIIALVALVIVLYLGKKRKTSYIPEFIAGALYGLWWEFSTETLFNYTNIGFSFYIWKDIPLAMILLWGVSIAGFGLISDYLQERMPLVNNNISTLANFKKRAKIKGGRINTKLKNSLFWDIIVVSVLGWSLEISGSQIFNMWSYPPGDYLTILNTPVKWLLGWTLVGVLTLSFLRRYKKILV